MKKTIIMIIAAVLMISLLGCSLGRNSEADSTDAYTVSRSDKRTELSLFAFDTYMTVTVYDNGNKRFSDDEARELADTVRKLEKIFSVTDTESELYAVNSRAGQKTELSPDMNQIVNKALDYSELTGGAFDISVYPVVKAWGFTEDEQRIPSDEELKELTGTVGYDRIVLKDGSLTIQKDMQIDLGGIAKGYLSDVLKSKLVGMGYTSALLSLGGNITAVGKKPDGNEFAVGISSPSDDEGLAGYLNCADMNVITSGNYKRFFIGADGVKYGHIIDPETGYPVNNGIESVTVIGAEGAVCDAFSTAIFIMGEEKAEELYKSVGGFEYIIIRSDKSCSVSEGIRDRFVPYEPFCISVR